MSRSVPLRWLALGDSYTIGEGVAADARWPSQVVAALRARGLDFDEPRIVATTGWTTDELAAAMDEAGLAPVAGDAPAVPAKPFDVVSLLIGVNNQYRGRDVDEYRREFTALLERAIALAGGRADRVLVLAIPDWGVTPFGQRSGRDTARIARELDAFNAAAEEICSDRIIAFVDVAPVSRAYGATRVADDGLHPSGALYSEWAALATPVVAGMFGR